MLEVLEVRREPDHDHITVPLRPKVYRTAFDSYHPEYPTPKHTFLEGEDGTRWAIVETAHGHAPVVQVFLAKSKQRHPRRGERLEVRDRNSAGQTMLDWMFAAGLAVRDKNLTRSPDGVLCWRIRQDQRVPYYRAWMNNEPADQHVYVAPRGVIGSYA